MGFPTIKSLEPSYILESSYGAPLMYSAQDQSCIEPEQPFVRG